MQDFNTLFGNHYGHEVEIAAYGKRLLHDGPRYTFECITCFEVIIHADDLDKTTTEENS